MQLTRLPRALIRREHGMVKDHLVILNEDAAERLVWYVNASFAGYLAGKMAELVDDAGAIQRLEARLQRGGLTEEAQALFADMVRTARRRRNELHLS